MIESAVILAISSNERSMRQFAEMLGVSMEDIKHPPVTAAGLLMTFGSRTIYR